MEARRGRGPNWEDLEKTLRAALTTVIHEISKPELTPECKMWLIWEWLGMALLKLVQAIGETTQDPA